MLLEQQNRISELINWCYEEEKKIEDKEILSSLTLDTYTGPQKENSVEHFAAFLREYRDTILGEMTRIGTLSGRMMRNRESAGR